MPEKLVNSYGALSLEELTELGFTTVGVDRKLAKDSLPHLGHQQIVREHALTATTPFVAFPTGSLWLRLDAMGTRTPFSTRAVRALLLYPMNALVNDQLGRLRTLFGSSAGC